MNQKRRIFFIIVLIVVLSLSFWLISRYPALDSKAAMSGMESFEDNLTPQAHFHVPTQAPFYTRVMYTTLNWYETNWKGMAFGLALAGAFLTLLSYLPRKNSDKKFKNSLMGMLVGTPLGVCVNCVAPIAKGIYDAGSKMETALAVMFSSPTLNIVILTMVFSIFPFYMALMKVGGTLVLVLLIVPLISHRDLNKKKEAAAALGNEIECVIDPEVESWLQSGLRTARDYLKSLFYIVVRTVPLMLLAGVLGALASHALSFEKFIGLPVNWKTLGLISFLGTFLPLPIAFDVMLAQALKVSGLADGFIMVLLFTLGTFSIYSAMIVYKTFSLKVAVQLYVIVAFLGMGLGYAANTYSDYQFVKWLEGYDRYVSSPGNSMDPSIEFSGAPRKPTVGKSISSHPTQRRMAKSLRGPGPVDVSYVPHRPRKKVGEQPFTKIAGSELGITYSNQLHSENFFDPFFFGRGIAAGDVTGDGWEDVVVATHKGFEVYQNINGKKFTKLNWPLGEIEDKEVIQVAVVDLNNDGRLDIFASTFGAGNYLWLAPEPPVKSPKVISVPNQEALLTNSVAFGDVDGDGYLDIVNGNYHLGVLTRTPVAGAANYLLLNRNLDFKAEKLAGIPGQTQTSLISDFNKDGVLDLMVGNDYRVSDTYYRGTGQGGFERIRKQDGMIPVTTENTMSMDTGDFNNDLVPDLYLSNIGFSKGIDVVSNIFGREMKEAGRNFCDSRLGVLEPGECHDLVKLVTLLNPERQDISERCSVLSAPQKVRDCMVTRLGLIAIKRKQAALCEKLEQGHALGRTLCNEYFKTEWLEMDRAEEIPFRPLSNILLMGNPEGIFSDTSESAGVTTAEWSWNAKFADLDNDEWQDLYVVNGVLITQEFATNNFFHNREGKRFEAAEKEFGLEDFDHSSSYVYIDMDNDGDLDIIGNTLYGPFKIYRNNSSQGHSVTFRLKDGKGNRFCIGCRIVIHYGPEGNRHQMRELKASGGFRSFDPPVMHFGLGEFDTLRRVEVFWSNGERTAIIDSFPTDREYIISR